MLINEGPSCVFSFSPTQQDFGVLTGAGGWTDNVTIPGWYISNPALFNNGFSDGSSGAGGFYVFDNAVATNKSLGTIASTTTGPLYIGLRIQNNTTKHIYAITFDYNARQWRRGENENNPNGYAVYWRTSPGPITTIPTSNPTGAGYTLATDGISGVEGYRYTAGSNDGNCGGGGTALDGNLPANTTPLGGTLFNFTSDPLPPGGEIMILFEDANEPCADHGIAIDDFNFGAVFSAPLSLTQPDPIMGDMVVCQNSTSTYTSLNTAPGSFIDWESIDIPPAQYSIIDDSTDMAQFVFGNVAPGTYTIRATPSTDCGTGAQPRQMTITVEAEPADPNAGPDQILCSATSTTLNGNAAAPDVGLWNFIGGPATPNIVTPNNPTTDVTNMTVPGLYEFEWTIEKASCGLVKRDTVIVDILAPTTVATAGADNSFCNPPDLDLTGNAPAPGETGSWSYISPGPSPPPPFVVSTGPGTADVFAVTPGFTYSFEYRITKPGCPTTLDTVTYTVASNTTAANAGPDQSICAVGTFTLSGNAINTATETAAWTFVSGPATPVVTMISATDAEASGFPATGSYVFRYEITNSPCASTSDEVTLTTTLPPSPAPNGGGDQFVCGATSTTLNGNAVTNGANSWRFYNTTTSTTPTIAQVGNDLNVSDMTENGVYRFIYSFQNPPCAALEDTIEVTVSDQTVPGTISGANEYCGPNFIFLNLSGNLGQVLRWEKSTDNFATVTNIANTTTTLADFISQTTQYRAVVQNPGCGIEISNTHLVRIDPLTQAGTLDFFQYSNNSICGSNIIGVFYLTGTIGNVVQWEYSTDNFATVDTIAHPHLYLNVPTDLPNPLIGATKFRAVLKSGICSEVRSNEFEILPTVQGLDLTLTGASGCDGYGAIIAEASNGSGVYDYFISPSAGFQQTPGMFNYVPENITYTVYARDRNTLCYTQKTITLASGVLAPPMVTGATNVASTAATLNWTAVPGFGVTYEARYRPIGPGQMWTILNPTSSTSRRITGLTPGVKYVYRVIAICRDGAQSALSEVVGVQEARFTTPAGRGAIAETQNEMIDLSVYPNPNNGVFTLSVSSNAKESASFTLTDVAGKTVYSEALDIKSGTNEIPVQLSGVAAGVYILRYQQNQTVRAVKLIVE